MKLLSKLYDLALRLYPGPFRRRFADEMAGVFAEGAEAARDEKRLAGFLFNELFKLPASLAHVYLWSVRAGAERNMALSGGPGGATMGPRESTRGEALLAGAPYLVMFFVLVIPEWLASVTGSSDALQAWMSTGSWIAVGALFATVMVYGLKKGFGRWSGTYLALGLVLLLALLGWVFNLFAVDSELMSRFNNLLTVFFGPLLLAYILYKLARGSRHAAVLAALPVMTVIWGMWQEFTPQPLRLAEDALLFGMGFAASLLIARARRITPALLAALGASALGGLIVVILSQTVGGYVVENNPLPLGVSVLLTYLPFLGGASALAIGPLLGAAARSLGREAAGAGGNAASRAALAGILILLVAAAARQWNQMDWGNIAWALMKYGVTFEQVITPVEWAGAAVYLIGFALLARAAIRAGALSGDNGAALSMLLLFFALPCVPLMLNWMLAFGSQELTEGWIRSAAAAASTALGVITIARFEGRAAA